MGRGKQSKTKAVLSKGDVMPMVEFVIPEEPALARPAKSSIAGSRHLLINARHDVTSIMVDEELTLTYDPEGRLMGAWIDGRNYRRSLGNHIIEKQEGLKPGLSYRVRRELDATETREFLSRTQAMVTEYRMALDHPDSLLVNEAGSEDCSQVYAALDRILKCDFARLEREAETSRQIYKPVNILPPDQYLSIVLQATEGCSYNQCAFCGFYRDRAFRIKSLSELQAHIAGVRALFGDAIRLRKSIFLADANALIIPQRQLLPLFDMINSEFDIQPVGLTNSALAAWRTEHPIHFEGVYSFIDAFTTRRKPAGEFRELAQRGLRRVYIGLESGDAELLRFLGKPNSAQDVIHLVDQIKEGGVAVGLIILAGAGGETFSRRHVEHTAELINALPLDKSDLIYFSELVDYAGSNYSALAQAAGIRSLSVEEIESQVALMRAAFRFADKEQSPKISLYDVREFVY
jgi:radical SAM superfamily enzyme YgiQ (UPF0313 family)